MKESLCRTIIVIYTFTFKYFADKVVRECELQRIVHSVNMNVVKLSSTFENAGVTIQMALKTYDWGFFMFPKQVKEALDEIGSTLNPIILASSCSSC